MRGRLRRYDRDRSGVFRWDPDGSREERRRPSWRRRKMHRSSERQRRLRDGGGNREGVLVCYACGYSFLSSVNFLSKFYRSLFAGASVPAKRRDVRRAAPRAQSGAQDSVFF